MKFYARATDINGVDEWYGFYAELKVENEISPVIIDEVESIPHPVILSTLRWFTGIFTGKNQEIYEGDEVQVWEDFDLVTGVVEWSRHHAGWVIKDSDGDYYDLVGTDRYFAK